MRDYAGDGTAVNKAALKPWGGADVNEWVNSSQAIVLTDMTECRPTSALSPVLQSGRWKIIPYEMTNGYTGKMIWAAPEANTPEVSIPLNAEGWHAIFVGLFSAPEVPTLAWLRLSEDHAPVSRNNKHIDSNYGNSEDVFFKVAKLSKDSCLHITQQNSGFISPCGVTHVKLIPLSQEEIEAVLADRADTSHQTMAATYDGFSSPFYRSPKTVVEWLSDLEIFRDTDFGTLLLHSPGADKVIYPTSVGYMKGSGVDVRPRTGDRYFVEAIQEMARQGINPLKVLIDGGHELGMKVHVGLRPAGWSYFEPFADYWESPFYRENPQWRCVDRDGTPVTRMSLAVPEVRKHFVDLLQEQVGFGADGAHIVFNRGYPLVLYEPTAREIFKKKYGEDPRNIDESDPQITQWWSDIVTTFMRELRDMLDSEQQCRGNEKHLELSIMVLGNEQDNLQYGVDVRRLVNEGLVDEVFTYKWDFGSKNRVYDLEFFREACQKKGVPFSPSTASYLNPPHYTLPLAGSFCGCEAKGIAIWDAGVEDIYQWSIISRFGHTEETLWRAQNLHNGNPPHTYYQFRKLGEQIRNGRFGPYWGG